MRKKHDGGSILMETVLVIPLYLAFLSGIFWVGDLALLRSKSTFFDRFAAWGSGNRHQVLSGNASKNLLSSFFLNPGKVGQQKIQGIATAQAPSGDTWSSIFGGTTVVSVVPPPWTDGWRRSASAMLKSNGKPLPETFFRSRETNAPFMHRNIMRAKNDFREKSTPQSLAERLEWLTRVYAASWPEEWTKAESPGVKDASACMKYERHKAFVQWSE